MKRADFRKKIDGELVKMGYKPGSWIWQTAPSRLTICIDGQFKDVPVKANMKKEDLAYWLGRLQGWADILELQPAQPKPVARKSRQIDLEDAIAAAVPA
ncbi:MAG: hypothetical protein AB7U76_24970 [Pirellulales bacterium]